MKSNAPEKNRSMLAARAYSQIREFSLAKEILSSLIAKQPNDIDLLLALANCHRDAGELKDSVKVLEQAYQIDQKREDVRRGLAVALATANATDDNGVWDRIASLMERLFQEHPMLASFFHAMLLASRKRCCSG